VSRKAESHLIEISSPLAGIPGPETEVSSPCSHTTVKLVSSSVSSTDPSIVVAVVASVTGLGWFVTLPVAIPSALAASWVVQARMAAAIARIYGHDLDAERVRTKILLSLAGDVAKEAMKDLGLKVGDQLTQRAVEQIPGRLLVEVNKRIAAKLAAQVGARVALRFPRAVPVFGGVVGGSLDAVVCRKVGRTAKTLFRPPSGAVMTGEVISRG